MVMVMLVGGEVYQDRMNGYQDNRTAAQNWIEMRRARFVQEELGKTISSLYFDLCSLDMMKDPSFVILLRISEPTNTI